MHRPPPFGPVMTRRSFPNNLVLKSFLSENRIHDDLQVVAGRGVTVEIDGAGVFEHPPQFHKADAHHRQVGHHVVSAHEMNKGPHHLHHVGGGRPDDLLKRPLGILRPVPRVVKGGDWASDGAPSGSRKSTLYVAFELNGGSR